MPRATKTKAKRTGTAKPKRLRSRQDIDDYLSDCERLQMKRRATPFDVHLASTLSPSWDDSDPPLEAYEWDAGAVAIAEAALMNGFQLSVPVRPDCVAFAVCRIVRALSVPVYAGYTTRHHRLLLWVCEDDRPEDAEDETSQEN